MIIQYICGFHILCGSKAKKSTLFTTNLEVWRFYRCWEPYASSCKVERGPFFAIQPHKCGKTYLFPIAQYARSRNLREIFKLKEFNRTNCDVLFLNIYSKLKDCKKVSIGPTRKEVKQQLKPIRVGVIFLLYLVLGNPGNLK